MRAKYGNILTERDEILKRWEEYVKELCGDTRGKKPDFGNVIPGPAILRCEMEKALRRMKWRKAEGNDGVVFEMVETAENFAITKLTDFANKICSTGNIPEKMEESEFIVIPKKEGATEWQT